MSRNLLSTSLITLLGLGLHSPLLTADSNNLATSMLVDTCITCHGPAGSSQGPAIPNIAGTAHDTFMATMQHYQTGERHGTIMNRIAKGYSNDELEVMAKYFSSQPVVRATQEIDAEKAEVGAALHKEYCEECHVNGGFKDEDGANVLAGQWLPYLQFNLADFHAKKRDMPAKMRKHMEKMVAEHGEASLEQLAHYYASEVKQP